MSGDDLEPMHDEIAALLHQERQREPIDPTASARIRSQVAASVGLGLSVGVGLGASASSASAKAATAVGVKAAASTTTSTILSTAGTAGALIAPKTLGIVSAVILAGGLSGVVATKVFTPSDARPSQPASKVTSRAEASAYARTHPADVAPVPTAAVPDAEPELLPSPSAVPPVVDAPKATAREASRDHDLAIERDLIARVRQAVAFRDWPAALSSLEQHRRKFSHGRLTEERESLRVPVLVMLGRHEEARTAAQRFHARYPTSIFAAGVNQAERSIP